MKKIINFIMIKVLYPEIVNSFLSGEIGTEGGEIGVGG